MEPSSSTHESQLALTCLEWVPVKCTLIQHCCSTSLSLLTQGKSNIAFQPIQILELLWKLWLSHWIINCCLGSVGSYEYEPSSCFIPPPWWLPGYAWPEALRSRPLSRSEAKPITSVCRSLSSQRQLWPVSGTKTQPSQSCLCSA